jgi:SAM-dependent methyltransferase
MKKTSMLHYLGQAYIDKLLAHDERYFRCVLDFFEMHVPKNAVILDVGAGVGSLVNILKNRGYVNITGIDPVKEYTEIGRVHFGLQKNLFSYNDLHLEKKSFDIVLSYTVAEHAEDIQAFIDFNIQFLKDKGIIYLIAPDYGKPGYFWRIIWSKIIKENLHLTPFTDGGILRSVLLFLKVKSYTFVRDLLKKPMIVKVKPVSPDRSVGGDADATWCCNYTDIMYCILRSPGILFEKIPDEHAIAGRIFRSKVIK